MRSRDEMRGWKAASEKEESSPDVQELSPHHPPGSRPHPPPGAGVPLRSEAISHDTPPGRAALMDQDINKST